MINTTTKEIQEFVLALLPIWHYRIAKPFKQLLAQGVSLEMYYCIQMLRAKGGELSMTELSRLTMMPKQQMTKIVNKLIEHNFIVRCTDESDRRVIKLKITENALEYIDRFLDNDAVYYKELFNNMTDNDREEFGKSIKTLFDIFRKIPFDESENPFKETDKIIDRKENENA